MLADGMGRRTNKRKGRRVGSLNTAGSTTAEGTMIPSTNTTNRTPRNKTVLQKEERVVVTIIRRRPIRTIGTEKSRVL